MAGKKNKVTRIEMIDVVIRAATRKFKKFKANGGNATEARIAVATVMQVPNIVIGLCYEYDYKAAPKTLEELISIYGATFITLATEL